MQDTTKCKDGLLSLCVRRDFSHTQAFRAACAAAAGDTVKSAMRDPRGQQLYELLRAAVLFVIRKGYEYTLFADYSAGVFDSNAERRCRLISSSTSKVGGQSGASKAAANRDFTQIAQLPNIGISSKQKIGQMHFC